MRLGTNTTRLKARFSVRFVRIIRKKDYSLDEAKNGKQTKRTILNTLIQKSFQKNVLVLAMFKKLYEILGFKLRPDYDVEKISERA